MKKLIIIIEKTCSEYFKLTCQKSFYFNSHTFKENMGACVNLLILLYKFNEQHLGSTYRCMTRITVIHCFMLCK